VLFPLLFPQIAATNEQAGKMRAAVYTSRPWNMKFDLSKVQVIDRDVPEPGRDEVLVKVHASNINPVDHKIVEMAGLIWSYPHKLGVDVAGVVVAVGSGCKRLKVGDEVWGEATTLLEAAFTAGTYAQYAAISEDRLGIKPKSLSWPEAGSMPMVALTSYDSLQWAAENHNWQQESVTVLVLGGSGGTGHLGIQLVKAMGAKKVITTCSGTHAEFVKSLGADQVIDYHKQNYSDVLPSKSVDVIYDCVGLPGTGDLAYPLLKENGHFITLLQDSKASSRTKSERPDVKSYAPLCVGKCSHYSRIDAIGSYVSMGKIKVHIDESYDLENIVEAFNHSISGHTTGKVAVTVSNTTGMTVVV
jgi:NADPH:quinone reductase-like Zn-dependent oxidoreductase